MISKARVLEHFGSAAAAAEFFEVTDKAIYQWDEKGQGIPRERELELMLRLPHVFGKRASDALPEEARA
jgi:hypothetical protein